MCRQAEQEQDETMDDYHTRLGRLASKYSFHDTSKEVKSQIVNGIESLSLSDSREQHTANLKKREETEAKPTRQRVVSAWTSKFQARHRHCMSQLWKTIPSPWRQRAVSSLWKKCYVARGTVCPVVHVYQADSSKHLIQGKAAWVQAVKACQPVN